MEILWIVIYWCAATAVTSALALVLLPRRWVVWSGLASSIMSGAPPPWRSTTRFGKAIYLILYTSVLALLALVTIGIFIEQ